MLKLLKEFSYQRGFPKLCRKTLVVKLFDSNFVFVPTQVKFTVYFLIQRYQLAGQWRKSVNPVDHWHSDIDSLCTVFRFNNFICCLGIQQKVKIKRRRRVDDGIVWQELLLLNVTLHREKIIS